MKMTGMPVLSLRGRNYKFWLSLEFFPSNYFQIGQHVVLLHILLLNILITHLKEAIYAVLF